MEFTRWVFAAAVVILCMDVHATFSQVGAILPFETVDHVPGAQSSLFSPILY